MTVRVEVREGESLSAAMHRLKKQAFLAHRRAWVKSRPGYFEKPSVLRRKRHKMDLRNIHAELGGGLRLWLRLEQQLARSGPFGMGK
jgi:ribosomal protein S21